MDEMRKFDAKIEQLPKMLKWVRGLLKKALVGDKEINKIEVAIEEALVNIISYAYSDSAGNIQINFHSNTDEVQLTILDQGVPFNPMEHVPQVDRNAPLDEREIGGLGIPFIDQLMDDVYYSRDGNTNALTMVHTKK